MKTSKALLDKAQESGKVKERSKFLKLAPKNEQGVSVPNGPHRLTLVSDRIITDSMGVQKLEVTVREEGIEKLWTINLKDAEGNLHYLVQALAEMEPGDEVIAEMKKNGAKSYVDLRKVGKGTVVPSVQYEDEEEELLPLNEEQDIKPDQIPF